MPASFVYLSLIFLVLVGFAVSTLVFAKWVARRPMSLPIVLVTVLGCGYWIQAAVRSNESTPNQISELSRLPIPSSAINCFVYVDGFEDTYIFMRCDIPASASPALVSAADWSQPIVRSASQSADHPWPADSNLPSWWSPNLATSWIELPSAVVSTGDQSPEPTQQAMLIDTSNQDIHRVFITRQTP